MTLVVALKIAGVLYLGLIWAGACMPRVVNVRAHLAGLPPFIRRLFFVYYAFIGLTLVSFGLITFCHAEALASGLPLGRAICVFLTLFWALRLVAAVFIFDVRPYLTRPLLRVGYHATNLVFAYLPIVYAWAAWKGGL